MKRILYLNLFIVLAFSIYSCSKTTMEGIWEDNIKLSTKSAEFSALGDSITIKTGGDWWWISDISVDNKWYYDFQLINIESNSYSIKLDCLVIERRDKNTLFIKVDSNPLNAKRIITVGLEAGDYFDRVTITQKPK